jgi:hypothetical protein
MHLDIQVCKIISFNKSTRNGDKLLKPKKADRCVHYNCQIFAAATMQTNKTKQGRMLSQMPRSFTNHFQFVPCEQTFWGYS